MAQGDEDQRPQAGHERLLARLVADVSDYAIFLLDPAGHIATWNAGAQRFKGYAAGEVVGRHFSVFYPPEDVAAGKPAWELEQAAAHGRIEDEGWRVRQDGSRFWANVVITALRDDDGILQGFGKVTRDLTERRAAELELRASEERFRLMVDAVQDYAILMLDPGGNVATWNKGAERIKGYTAAQVVGHHFSRFYTPEDNAAGRPGQGLELAVRDGRWEDQGWRLRKDGTRFWADVVITALRDEHGELRGFGKVTRDLTERRVTDQRLRAAEERFRRAFRDAPVGLAIADARPGRVGRLLDVNRALCDLVGTPREQLLELGLADLVHPADRARHGEVLAELLAGGLDRHQGELRFRHATGDAIDAAVSTSLVRDADGTPLQLIAQVDDISARKRYEQQLRHMAQHDPLTGLYDRGRFHQALDAHVARIRRYGPTGALLMIDLDRFKLVNDRLGHGAGDQLLVSVARILQSRVRDTDLLARLGGDEFVVLMSEGGEAEAQTLAADLSDLVRRRSVVLEGGAPGGVTASIGIAVFDDRDALRGDDVVAEADAAMYAAKQDGRNRISAYVTADGVRQQLASRRTLHDRIDQALRDERFVLHLQPVLDLRTGVLGRYEALLRMRDEDGSLVAPATFLYVAERFDQIHAIDRWVIEQAPGLLEAMRSDQALEINLSGRSLGDPALARHIQDVVLGAGVDPSRLVFEITETAAIENIHRARAFAQELTNVGCRFALDDFGAGFGSFYYLKYLPFDYLKIDGEFVKHCTDSRTDQLMIRSCVQLAQGLGKQTIAEFVETEEILRLVRALGVDHAQGYEVARPLPVAEALALAQGLAR